MPDLRGLLHGAAATPRRTLDGQALVAAAARRRRRQQLVTTSLGVLAVIALLSIVILTLPDDDPGVMLDTPTTTPTTDARPTGADSTSSPAEEVPDPPADRPSTDVNDALLNDDEQALLDAFVAFARTPTAPAPTPLRWADEVSLHLADGPPSARFTPEEATGPVWSIEAEAFRAYNGPFNPLEQITQTTFPLTFGAGPHPHCAAEPVPAPDGLASLRRLWVQPEGTTSCLQWFTVDLFINDDGAVAAVSMDLWEP